MPSGGVLHLLGDDPESLHDIPVLLERLGLPPAEISDREIGWLYVITNSAQ
jgi:TusA-related sulfurtransferase